MEPDRRERRCLTCGGPAVLCERSSRCVGLYVTNVSAPPPVIRSWSRTGATLSRAGWRVRAAVTAAIWLFGLVVARSFTHRGLPLLIFAGVPYAVASVVLTRALWRVRPIRL